MRQRVRFVVGFLLAVALIAMNAVYEWPYAVRFSYSPLNNICTTMLVLAVPVSLAYLGGTLKQGYQRNAARVVAVALFVLALLGAALALVDLESEDTLLDEFESGSSVYRLYMREPALITSPPFTLLRKEIDTHLGIKLIRTIWKSERYGRARLRRSDDATVGVEMDDGFLGSKLKIK